jgi:hypothetical protein
MVDGLADIAERLMAEFDGRHAPNVVSNVVRGAAQDLAATPAGAWAEMVERAARQRLLELE